MHLPGMATGHVAVTKMEAFLVGKTRPTHPQKHHAPDECVCMHLCARAGMGEGGERGTYHANHAGQDSGNGSHSNGGSQNWGGDLQQAHGERAWGSRGTGLHQDCRRCLIQEIVTKKQGERHECSGIQQATATSQKKNEAPPFFSEDQQRCTFCFHHASVLFYTLSLRLHSTR